MKKFFFAAISVFAILLSAGCDTKSRETRGPDEMMNQARVILMEALDNLGDTTVSPRSLDNGKIRFVRSGDWTSGFFPGILWMIYEYSGEDEWKDAAIHYSMNIEDEKMNGGTHDMGFKMYCSFGNGYRLSADPNYRDILLQSAGTLKTRFNPKVGCIRSWDHNDDKWDYPVIIDNMMNLELLFWAFRETGDSSFYKVALKHAETTMQNHFRDDYSSYHVISYDTISGKVAKRNTHQGYSDESAWARGQAWGLYGFTMTYRETSEKQFLDLARHIAGFMLNHPNLPEDKVPYWDYDAPGQPDIPRDASAAAITASALYELSTYCPEEKQFYKDFADHILASLSSDRYFRYEEQVSPFLLDHSVGNYNKSDEIDVPIIYADYYYLEALMRKRKLSVE